MLLSSIAVLTDVEGNVAPFILDDFVKQKKLYCFKFGRLLGRQSFKCERANVPLKIRKSFFNPPWGRGVVED